MNKFKLGDKAVYVKESTQHFTKGKIYIYEKNKYTDAYPNDFTTTDDTDRPNGMHFSNFESVSESKVVSDQQLIDKLNEGMKARAELIKRNVKLEAFRKNLNWGYFGADDYCIQEYRIAEKKFKNFTTSKGWLVELFGDDLHIGCKHFELKLVKKVLQDLLLANLTLVVDSTAGTFGSTRNGITFGSYLLPWKDAEQILNALNEMEK